MNILQINTADTRGGAAKVAYHLKRELKELGHQTTMFVGEKFSSDPEVFLLNDKKSFTGRLRKKLSYYLANDIDVFSSDKIIQTEQFKKADIIHCHNLHSYYFNLHTLSKISAIKPVVWTFHDMWPITAHCAHSFGNSVKNGFFQCPSKDIFPPIAWHNEKYLEKTKEKIYQKSKFKIVVPSLWLKNKVEKSILGNQPVSLIYNGVDTDIFKPRPKEEARRELGLPQDKKIILSVVKRGRSNPWKGANYVGEIIEHWSDKKDIVFVCIGSANNNRPNVIDVPYVDGEKELAKYYSAADALLYPSIADNCPLVLIEAQACGLSVVAFETGGIPEIIKHNETGYIARYKDRNSLEFYLNKLISDNDQALQRIREESQKIIGRGFDSNFMAKKYVELYDQFISEK